MTTVKETERYDGIWWTPDHSDREVSGSLHVTPENGIVLQMNGSLREDPDTLNAPPSSHDLILGMQSSGFPFTLQGCTEHLHRSSFGGGYSTQHLVVDTVYSGFLADEHTDLAFSKYLIDLTHLSDWMRNVGVGDPEEVEGGYFIAYDPDGYTTTPEMVVGLDDIRVQFNSKPYWSSGGKERSHAGVNVNDWVEIHSASPISVLDVSARLIEPIRDFLSLATVRPNSITRLDGFIPAELNGKAYDKRVQIHTTTPYRRAPEADLFNRQVILFYASDIADNPSIHIERWLELECEMRDVCELFFGVHYDQGAFNTNRFLNVVQALESFSRVRYGPPNTRRFLGERLIELAEKASPLTDNLFPDTEEFVAWTVETRNFYTHLDASNKKRIAKDGDLDLLASSLLWLLRVHFLLEIAFDKAKCQELLSNSVLRQGHIDG